MAGVATSHRRAPKENERTDIHIIYVAQIAACFNQSNRFDSALGIHPNAHDHESFR